MRYLLAYAAMDDRMRPTQEVQERPGVWSQSLVIFRLMPHESRQIAADFLGEWQGARGGPTTTLFALPGTRVNYSAQSFS